MCRNCKKPFLIKNSEKLRHKSCHQIFCLKTACQFCGKNKRLKKGEKKIVGLRESPKVVRKEKRYFHATPKRLRMGTILTKDMPGSLGAVFLTTSEIPHYTVVEVAAHFGWHIYEVKPLDRVRYGETWDELFCDRAEIVRYCGSARGITRRANLRFREKDNDGLEGSKVATRRGGKFRKNSVSFI